jgi:glycosyltransferase involved in cell wall biosynthesis
MPWPQATILILPSAWFEAFPVVIAEAFASGLPIIASRRGPMAELIADGHAGKLSAPGNATELANTVEWVYLRPEHMRRMRISARAEYEQKYTAETNHACFMSIYEAALGHSREPALSVPRLEAIG